MICTSLAINNFWNLSEAIKKFEMAEVRIDICGLNKEETARIFSSRSNLIATCRPGWLNESQRILLLKEAVTSGASFVDIEVDSPTHTKKEILKAAAKRGCRVIISYHNNARTPSVTKLKKIVRQCFAEGADLCKIACRCLSIGDMMKILSLYGEFEDFKGKIIALGTGDKAVLTRIMAPFLGAPFTYAALSESEKTAEGQLSFKKMQTLISHLKKVMK
ncbi:MAG: type I 3-dehydroquinate dehydratase [Acidobacteriota bacterium]